MQSYAIMLVAILIMLLASFGAAYMGQWLLGTALFILALTPAPVAGGYRLYHRIVHAKQPLRGHGT